MTRPRPRLRFCLLYTSRCVKETGLSQVNRYNLGKYGLDSYEKAFEPCANRTAGSKILAECYHRAGGDWGKSFSCYYSGNFSTGFRHGYVQKIYACLLYTSRCV